MQSLIQPLVARSAALPLLIRSRRNLSPPQADPFRLTNESYQPAPQTPFQAALLVYPLRQRDGHTKAAYVAYFHQEQLIHLERLHTLRGHNPAINCQAVIKQARQLGATQVLLASGVESTSEEPYADEFAHEVERQYETLRQARLFLLDNLRVSLMGAYSYYGDHSGPFADAPGFHERSLCRLY
jgi:hypothetical protein